MSLAAIITCFNRKSLTLACLDSLFSFLPDADVYLTDDGCTDGTDEAVRAKYPQVHIIKGTGNLYWSRGMYTAWREALKGDYDNYLWLNDDLVLYADFFDEMMACREIVGQDCIVTGLVEDLRRHKIIYGGYDQDKRSLQATGKPQEVAQMNGNVVLVPRSVVQRIGILDPYYLHDIGDTDYGLTALRNGIKVITTRKAIASGSTNDPCRVRLWNSNIVKRFRKLNNPLGSPLSKNFHFRRKHFGLLHALAFNSYVIMINVMPDWMVVLFWGNAYVDDGEQSS